MAYRVQIIDTQTGEARWAEMPFDWFKPSGNDDLYWWTDGNFGCDCNRGAEFIRAGGREPTEAEWACTRCPSGNRYRVTHAELPDGQRIEIDGEHNA